ncbi:unnamed protein product [Natator depressus]
MNLLIFRLCFENTKHDGHHVQNGSLIWGTSIFGSDFQRCAWNSHLLLKAVDLWIESACEDRVQAFSSWAPKSGPWFRLKLGDFVRSQRDGYISMESNATVKWSQSFLSWSLRQITPSSFKALQKTLFFYDLYRKLVKSPPCLFHLCIIRVNCSPLQEGVRTLELKLGIRLADGKKAECWKVCERR